VNEGRPRSPRRKGGASGAEPKSLIAKEIEPNGRLAADAFHVRKAAGDAEDRIVYDRVTGNLYYDPDGTGPLAQTRIALLTNKTLLKSADVF
jgi:hypothetical protein